MALVQDPGFWKRFSTAAHLDEEEKLSNASNSPNGRPNLKHSYVLYPSPSASLPPTPTSVQQPLFSPFPHHSPGPHCHHTNPFATRDTNPSRKSWLDRQKKKRARRTIVCWVFWIIFTAVVTGVVIAVLLLKAKGVIGGHNDKAAADENAGSYAVGGSGP